MQEQRVGIRDLKINMALRQDIRTTRGQLVARKGQQITESLQQIIRHCLQNKAVDDDLKVAVSEVELHE